MSNTPPSPLDQANERLNKAFSKLEATVKHLDTPTSAPISAEEKETIQAEITASWQTTCDELNNEINSLKTDCENLREENARLSTQLQEAQQDYLDLQQVNNQVADELDDQAKQLDLIAHVQSVSA